MKLKNIRYMKKVKGSVLLTVICVMFVMLIIVTATLTLAANASNRAYSNYMKNQATYTARSAVGATIKRLQEDAASTGTMSTEIFAAINASPTKEVELSVTGAGGNELGSGYGDVAKVVIKDTGLKDDKGSYYIAGTGKEIYQITAYTNIGGKNVTYSQYVNGSMATNPTIGGGSGFISLGSAAGGTSTGTSIYGGSGSNIAFVNPNEIQQLRNPTVNIGDKFFNSNVYINTATTFNLDTKEGVVVNGSLLFQNNSSIWESLYSIPATGVKVIDVPYLYVEKTLGIQTGLFIGTDHPGANPTDPLAFTSKKNPINIYAGRILVSSNHKFSFNSDIYLYNEGTPNTINIPNVSLASETNYTEFDNNPSLSVFEVAGSSSLIDWYAGGQSLGGGLYSKGSVYFDLSNSAFTIPGNIYVKGDLRIKGNKDLTVSGKVNVEGNIIFDGTSTINGKTSKADAGLIDTTLLFPPSMEKTEILGGGDSANKIVKTQSDVDAMYYLPKEYLKDPITGKIIGVDKVNSKLKGQKVKSEFPAASTFTNKYSNSGSITGTTSIPSTISNSCAIIGDIKGKVITFRQPSSDTTVKEINVLLVNLNTQGEGSVNTSEFIIDDRDYSPTAIDPITKNATSKFRVNFYIATSDVYTASDFGVTTIENSINFTNMKFITKYYNDMLYYNKDENGNPISIPYSIIGNPLDCGKLQAIPDVYVWAPADTTQTININFTNESIFTGNIFAPTAVYEHKKGQTITNVPKYSIVSVDPITKAISSEKKIDTKDQTIAVIGSVVVNEIKQFENDSNVYVVSTAGLKHTVNPPGNYAWQPINGFSNY